MAGNRPFRSQAAKKNVQSMNGTMSSSGTLVSVRTPVKDGRGQRFARPVDLQPVRARRLVREQRTLFARAVLIAQTRLQSAILFLERRAALVAQQARHDIHDARCVEHVHGGSVVLGRNLDCRVLAARGCAADQQRHVKLRRVISFATNTISSSDGVMSPLSPITSARWSMAVCRILSAGTITPRSTTS